MTSEFGSCDNGIVNVCSKVLNTFLFQFSYKILVIMAGNYKMLVANMPLQGGHCSRSSLIWDYAVWSETMQSELRLCSLIWDFAVCLGILAGIAHTILSLIKCRWSTGWKLQNVCQKSTGKNLTWVFTVFRSFWKQSD